MDITKSNKEIFESCGKTAANIIMYFEDDSRQSFLEQLRDEVKKCCEMGERVKAHRRIFDDILATCCAEDETDHVDNQKNHLVEYTARVSEIAPDVSKNENLIEFDRIVKVLQGAQNKNNEDNDGEDGELLLTHDTVNLIDPITKRRMTDPMKNTVCGHIYDRESVVGLLSQNPKTRCPVPGCRNKEYLSMANMISDIVTKTFLDRNPV